MLMHSGMAGPHRFEITVESNDPAQPKTALTVKANYVEK